MSTRRDCVALSPSWDARSLSTKSGFFSSTFRRLSCCSTAIRRDAPQASLLLRGYVPGSPLGSSRFPPVPSPTNLAPTRFGVFAFRDTSENCVAHLRRDSRGEPTLSAFTFSVQTRWRLLCCGKMKQVEFTGKHEVRCDGCGPVSASYDTVSYGSIERGYRQLCSQCFNQDVAKLGGLDKFEHAKFTPVGLVDCDGEVHEFHFRTHLFGPGGRSRCLRTPRRRAVRLPVPDHRRSRR